MTFQQFRAACRATVVFLGVLLLHGCGEKLPADPAALRAGLVTPGSIADAAWNSGAYRGLQQLKDSLGFAISHVEARTPAEQEEALRNYAAQGYRLVFAHGFEFQQPAEQLGTQYPGTIFVVTSGERAVGNVVPLVFSLNEASYLAGIVAGSLTTSKRIGFVGGVEIPPVRAAYEGWVAGARSVDPSIDTRVTYLNNWDDAAAGREAALALISLGVDIFHHNADAAALGLFQAAKEAPGVTVFGANEDQAALAPAQVAGSAVIDLPRAFLLIGREVKDGTFAPRVERFGLRSGVVRFDWNPQYGRPVPAPIRARVAQAADSIIQATPTAAGS